MQARCHTESRSAISTPRTDGMKMIQQHTPAATFLSESPPRPMVTAMPLSHTDQEGNNQPRTPRLDFDGQCDQRCSETHESCELLSCNHQITYHLSLCGETQGDMGCSLRDIELFQAVGPSKRNSGGRTGWPLWLRSRRFDSTDCRIVLSITSCRPQIALCCG